MFVIISIVILLGYDIWKENEWNRLTGGNKFHYEPEPTPTSVNQANSQASTSAESNCEFTPSQSNNEITKTWLTFKSTNQYEKRRFTFRYPSQYEIGDYTSDLVWIMKNGEYWLGIDDRIDLTYTQREGRSRDEQYRIFYEDHYSNIQGYQPLEKLQRVDFNTGFFYIRPAYPDVRGKCQYTGLVDKNGFQIENPVKFSDETVLSIVKSIRFEE